MGLSTAEKWFIRDYYDNQGGYADVFASYPMFGITKASFAGSVLLFASVGCQKDHKLCNPVGAFQPKNSFKVWRDQKKIFKAEGNKKWAEIAQKKITGLTSKPAMVRQNKERQRYQGLVRITRIQSSQQSTAD